MATAEMFYYLKKRLMLVRHIDRLWIKGLEMAVNSWRKRPWIVLDNKCRNPVHVGLCV